MKSSVLLSALALCVVSGLTSCAGAGNAARSVPDTPSKTAATAHFPVPAKIAFTVPRAPAMRKPQSVPDGRRRTLDTQTHPPFFAGEVALSNGVYYLAIPDPANPSGSPIPFGYYSYLGTPNWIYHFDLGYLYYIDAGDGQGGINLYDNTTGHWWYTNRQWPFPYIYDFYLNSMLYYDPVSPGSQHYTTNPRYFNNFVTSHQFAMPDPNGPRAMVWQIGDLWGLNGTGDGQTLTDQPQFSGSPASCDYSDLHCAGGTGTVSFRVHRSNDVTQPSAEYRNMMVLQKTDPTFSDPNYGFGYNLIEGQAYDVRFQTVYRYSPEAQGVPSILWEVGGGDNALGVMNNVGTGNRFFYNTNNSPGPLDFQWRSEPLQTGQMDTWEIQMLWTRAGTGWTHVYRNGTRVVQYSGPVEPSAGCDPNCFMAFGVYYYNWEAQNWNNPGAPHSTVLEQNMTFNYFELTKIPGPVDPM